MTGVVLGAYRQLDLPVEIFRVSDVDKRMSKIRNRASRLVTGALVPAFIFAVFTVVITATGFSLPHIPAAFGSIPGFLGLILAGWIFGGVQCMLYSALMGFIINPKVHNERFSILISGLFLSMIIWSAFPIGFPVSLLVIGFAVGCIVGYILRDMYKYYA